MEQKRLDSLRDLNKGERQYLARKGIKGRDFDKMSTTAQHEWKEEMKNPAYDKSDYKFRTQNRRFEY